MNTFKCTSDHQDDSTFCVRVCVIRYTWKLGNYYHNKKQYKTVDYKNSSMIQREQYISLSDLLDSCATYDICVQLVESFEISELANERRTKAPWNIVFLQAKQKARRCLFLFEILSRDMVLVGILFFPLYTLVCPSGTFKLQGEKKSHRFNWDTENS